MTIIVTTRSEPLVDQSGLASLRFAELLESLVDTVNDLSSLPVNTQDSNYTFILTDANGIVRKTSITTQQVYTIPSNDSVAFDIGTRIEVQNDGTVDMKVAIADDTLTSEAGLGTGTRTIAKDGSAVLRKVAATNWKIRGEQMT